MINPIPHPDQTLAPIGCGIFTISDTRTPDTDRSGQTLQALLQQAGHQVVHYQILKDNPEEIQAQVQQWVQYPNLQALLINGGTGIAPRDSTYEAIASLLEKEIAGFGELFRSLSYQEIGSRAMASRAIAGVYQGKLIFSMPGSTGAVKLAIEKLILPELRHLISLLQT